jgi:hypothetical protein
MFTICKSPGDPDYRSFATREDAVQGVRELFESGVAERGEFYIAERDSDGKVVRVFSVDDEVAPPTTVALEG